MPSVPVPVAASVTVTSAVVAVERVAVSVRLEPAFSAILEADDESVTVGADSSSVIVSVPVASEIVAPETLESVMVAVSFPS